MIKCVIHCSDSPQGRGDSAETIHKWHKDERGFDGIGYHYVILEDGTIENGRPDYWSGAHAIGFNDALGVCLIGRSEFTEFQYVSLEKILVRYGLTKDEVVGHYEIDDSKTCPNFDVEDYLDNIGL